MTVFSIAHNVKAFDQDKDWEKAENIYQFHAKDIKGNDVSFSKYQDHPLIVVNVASKCGLTETNYKQLQELYEQYEGKGLRILGFPSGDFMNQEYDTSKEILDFIKQYNVTFDMFEKIHVNGDETHPLWKYLKSRQGGFITNGIKWNFTKFIVDKKGQVVARFGPQTEPKEMEETLMLYL